MSVQMLTPTDVLPPLPTSPNISLAARCDGSPKCRLVDSVSSTPINGNTPDEPRLDFGEFQKQMTYLAKEFFCARDVPGMMASIKALGCSSFHDELVAILLRASLDRNEPERAAVVTLLGALATEGLLSTAQAVRGFEKLVLSWDDIQLDVPGAPGQLVALLSSKLELLDESFFTRLPEDLLRTLADGLAPGTAQDSLQTHVQDLANFKAKLMERIEADLFCERSVGTLAAWLRTTGKPAFFHEVVVAACMGSCNTNASASWMSWYDAQGLVAAKRDLVLDMLSQLHSDNEGWLLDEVDLQLGFSRFLGQMGNQATAVCCTPEILVGLLRGALEQKILPAEFFKSARRMRFGGLSGVKAIREVQRQTPKLSRRDWGSGDIKQFREEVWQTILEYFDSKSVEELAQVVEELRLTEEEQVKFVRKMLVAGMEHAEPVAALDAVEELMGRSWSKEVVRKAFEQLREIDVDLVLDLPHCRKQTDDLFQAAAMRGLLEEADLLYDGITIV